MPCDFQGQFMKETASTYRAQEFCILSVPYPQGTVMDEGEQGEDYQRKRKRPGVTNLGILNSKCHEYVPGQETGCSSWFCTLNNSLVSEVILIHLSWLPYHFNHFSCVKLLFPAFHLPAWHCPSPSPLPSLPNPVFCLVESVGIRVQTLSFSFFFYFSFYIG